MYIGKSYRVYPHKLSHALINGYSLNPHLMASNAIKHKTGESKEDYRDMSLIDSWVIDPINYLRTTRLSEKDAFCY